MVGDGWLGMSSFEMRSWKRDPSEVGSTWWESYREDNVVRALVLESALDGLGSWADCHGVMASLLLLFPDPDCFLSPSQLQLVLPLKRWCGQSNPT